jgi:hypothetical protein
LADGHITSGSAQDLSGLTPIKVLFVRGPPFAEWVDMGGRSFAEPLFRDSVRGALQAPSTEFSRRVHSCFDPFHLQRQRRG